MINHRRRVKKTRKPKNEGRQFRVTPMTSRWAKCAFNLHGLEDTKENRKILRELWHKGYSHKDAAQAIKDGVNNG